MLWLPTDSAVVESDAVPPLSVAVPRGLAPSKNCTGPVAAGDTVAVKVTDCPDVDGFAEEATVVVVGVSDWPHEGNWKEMMRVFQATSAVDAWYSCVYQKVQSLVGSILIAEQSPQRSYPVCDPLPTNANVSACTSPGVSPVSRPVIRIDGYVRSLATL